jgi:hypothetical protein
MFADRDGRPSAAFAQALAEVDIVGITEAVRQASLENFFAAARGDQEFEAAYAAGTSTNSESLRALIAGQRTLADVEPSPSAALAVLHARLGIPQDVVLRAHNAAIERIWDGLMDRLPGPLEGSEVSPEEVFAGLSWLHGLVCGQHYRVLEAVLDAYVQEQKAQSRSQEQMRRRALRGFLAGGEDDSSEEELSGILRYNMKATHLAVLLPDCGEASARPVCHAVARAIGAAGGPLFLPIGTTTVCWLRRDRPFSANWHRSVHQALAELRVKASLGEPAAGPNGFRLTYEQTRRVEAIRSKLGSAAPPVMTFRDFQLDLFFINNPEEARGFVGAELGQLSAKSTRAEELRNTLKAWLESGHNVSTAAILRVHEHTVRNRLRQAEQMIGHPLAERRIQMQVALRLYPMLLPLPGSTRAAHRTDAQSSPEGTDTAAAPPSAPRLYRVTQPWKQTGS